MNTSKQAAGGNAGSTSVTSPATPVTTSSFTGFKKKNTDDPSGFPPLPEPVAHTPVISEEFKFLPDDQLRRLNEVAMSKSQRLDAGCYLLKFSPIGSSYHYDGTIRVEKAGSNTIASGDLYYHKPFTVWPGTDPNDEAHVQKDKALSLFGEPNPANGIPIFSRKNYRYYLRVTQIMEVFGFSKTFTLGFEMWKFNGVSASPMWSLEGVFNAEMTWASSISGGYPSGADFLTGSVKSSFGSIVGNITMGWVSEYLRMATIEIDTVANVKSPVNSGLGDTWESIFDKVGWKIKVIKSNNDISEPTGTSWSDGEMHKAMLDRRDNSDLDSEWRYHILVVQLIDSTSRGIMYDASATDSNRIPREGIGIAYKWMIPDEPLWGKVRGMYFGKAKAPFFRTALHEIGHAMGLYHNAVDMGIMNTTDVIAANAKGSVQFPDNIKWAHAADDQKRLRHMPDIFVRPGGVPFGTAYSIHPLSMDDEQEEAYGLELVVRPVFDVIPIGAPVRLELSLRNISKDPLQVPKSLHMKYGCVKGKVIDPSGNVRTFSPLVICVDELPIFTIDPGGTISDSLTLLRGVEGALFSAPGIYTVQVEVSWDLDGGHVGLIGGTNIYVTSNSSEDHARAAMQILSTPDTLLSLVLTGDHHKEGNAAIDIALTNPVLRPHYEYLEFKRFIQPFDGRIPEIFKATKYITEESVMSVTEIRKAIQLLLDEGDPIVPKLKAAAPNTKDNVDDGTDEDQENLTGGGRLDPVINSPRPITRDEELVSLREAASEILDTGGRISPTIKATPPLTKDEIDEVKRVIKLLFVKYDKAVEKLGGTGSPQTEYSGNKEELVDYSKNSGGNGNGNESPSVKRSPDRLTRQKIGKISNNKVKKTR